MGTFVMHACILRFLLPLWCLAFAPAARCDEAPRFDIGLRIGVAAADGEPANDMPGAGIVGHYRLSDAWTIGAALERSEFDFEEPAKVVGIQQSTTVDVIDALAESTSLRFWAARALSAPARPLQLFAGVGVGAATLDVPDVDGPRASGGRFDIRTDVDDEFIASLLGGVRRRFGERWYAEAQVHLDHHFADWRIHDRVSGARARIGNYTSWGANLTVGVAW